MRTPNVNGSGNGNAARQALVAGKYVWPAGEAAAPKNCSLNCRGSASRIMAWRLGRGNPASIMTTYLRRNGGRHQTI